MMYPLRSVAVLLLLALACCGGKDRKDTARIARASLGTALGATNSARDTFLTWAKAHELELVAAATSKEDGTAKLAAFRRDSQPIVAAFATAYTSIAAADTALALAEASPGDLARAVELATAAVRAVLDVQDAFRLLKTKGGA